MRKNKLIISILASSIIVSNLIVVANAQPNLPLQDVHNIVSEMKDQDTKPIPVELEENEEHIIVTFVIHENFEEEVEKMKSNPNFEIKEINKERITVKVLVKNQEALKSILQEWDEMLSRPQYGNIHSPFQIKEIYENRENIGYIPKNVYNDNGDIIGQTRNIMIQSLPIELIKNKYNAIISYMIKGSFNTQLKNFQLNPNFKIKK